MGAGPVARLGRHCIFGSRAGRSGMCQCSAPFDNMRCHIQLDEMFEVDLGMLSLHVRLEVISPWPELGPLSHLRSRAGHADEAMHPSYKWCSPVYRTTMSLEVILSCEALFTRAAHFTTPEWFFVLQLVLPAKG